MSFFSQLYPPVGAPTFPESIPVPDDLPQGVLPQGESSDITNQSLALIRAASTAPNEITFVGQPNIESTRFTFSIDSNGEFFGLAQFPSFGNPFSEGVPNPIFSDPDAPPDDPFETTAPPSDCSVCRLADAIYNRPNNPKRDGDVSQIDVCLPPTRLLQPAIIPTSPAAVTTATGFSNLIAQINGTNSALPDGQAIEQVRGTATWDGLRQQIAIAVDYLVAGQVVGRTVDVFPCNGLVGVQCSTLLGEIEVIQFGVGIAPGAQGQCECAGELGAIKTAIDRLTDKAEELRAIQFDIARLLIRGLPRATFWAFAFDQLTQAVGTGLANLASAVNGIARVFTFREGDTRSFQSSPAGSWVRPVAVNRLRAIDLNEPAQGQAEPYLGDDLEVINVEPTGVERGETNINDSGVRVDVITLTSIPENASVIRNGDGSLRYKAGNVRYMREEAGVPTIFGEVKFISLSNQTVSSDVPNATGLQLNPETGFEFSVTRIK